MAALTAAEEHENKRRAKWTQYLVKHPLRANQTPRTDETFVRLVQGGIASIYREQIWLQASGAYLLWRTETGFYQNMVARPVDPESVLAREVEKDILRTFADHPTFSDPNAPAIAQLRRILLAYGRRNESVGYCQGMNYIAGMYLMLGISEDMAFWLLVATIDFIIPPDYFSTSLLGVQTDERVFGKVLDRKLPRLAKHLRQHQVPTALAVVNWFLTGFICVLPIEMTVRIWDRVYVEGWHVVMYIALAIMSICESRFLAESSQSMLYALLVQAPALAMEQQERLWQLSLSPDLAVPVSAVDSLREECRAHVEKEMAEDDQKRRLAGITIKPPPASSPSNGSSASHSAPLSLASDLERERTATDDDLVTSA